MKKSGGISKAQKQDIAVILLGLALIVLAMILK